PSLLPSDWFALLVHLQTAQIPLNLFSTFPNTTFPSPSSIHPIDPSEEGNQTNTSPIFSTPLSYSSRSRSSVSSSGNGSDSLLSLPLPSPNTLVHLAGTLNKHLKSQDIHNENQLLPMLSPVFRTSSSFSSLQEEASPILPSLSSSSSSSLARLDREDRLLALYALRKMKKIAREKDKGTWTEKKNEELQEQLKQRRKRYYWAILDLDCEKARQRVEEMRREDRRMARKEKVQAKSKDTSIHVTEHSCQPHASMLKKIILLGCCKMPA
ncbi:hypothetical protein PMAYCL1PPCAC_28817, partial [Pristionchus mayeri]